ncbi:hypothetical protein BDF14DRAFT_95878 [Spinellus fusiger]|nr:hypothetical protein BDF14DRAFT_95878 [Spinellus fusiger]
MTLSPSLTLFDILRVLEDQAPKIHNDTIIEHRVQMQTHRDEYYALYKETGYLRKTVSLLKEELQDSRKVQERLESQLYAQEKETAHVSKEVQSLTRLKKETEKRLETELKNHEKDRLLWQQREIDLCNEVKRKLSMDPPPRRTRSATASNIWDKRQVINCETCGSGRLGLEGRPTLLTCQDAKIRTQEKVILDLNMELQHEKRVACKAMATMEEQTCRIAGLEEEISGVKELNASLMEDNESYQMLLHERTLTGEMFMNVHPTQQEHPFVPSPTSLAAELNKVGEGQWESDLSIRKLTEEVKALQEANKALALYMNKILLKIIDHQLLDVLNIDEAPPVVRPRRSTISTWETSPKATESASTSGWTKALRRMTVLGWSGSKPESTVQEDASIYDSAISSRASESSEDIK